MTTQFRRNSAQDMIAQIEEGMVVYDNCNQRVGVVEFIKFTDEEPDAIFLNDTPSVFDDPDDISDSMRYRLVREGYLRIDGGFLAQDRIALLDQIASVSHNDITLNVSRDDLILL